MSAHIYHATATLAELTLAMSIGTFTKILVQAPVIDSIARDTTIERIETQDGKIALLTYKIGCWLTSSLGFFTRNIPLFSFVSELAVLGGMAFSPDTIPVSTSLFLLSLFCFFIMIGYIYFNRETFTKTNEKPLIEPVD